uniref:Uncharacterized protein n=1 Tax=Salix viminalis TaxID=40686 RepID=A0A6N2JVZ7_SALVM
MIPNYCVGHHQNYKNKKKILKRKRKLNKKLPVSPPVLSVWLGSPPLSSGGTIYCLNRRSKKWTMMRQDAKLLQIVLFCALTTAASLEVQLP